MAQCEREYRKMRSNGFDRFRSDVHDVSRNICDGRNFTDEHSAAYNTVPTSAGHMVKPIRYCIMFARLRGPTRLLIIARLPRDQLVSSVDRLSSASTAVVPVHKIARDIVAARISIPI